MQIHEEKTLFTAKTIKELEKKINEYFHDKNFYLDYKLTICNDKKPMQIMEDINRMYRIKVYYGGYALIRN